MTCDVEGCEKPDVGTIHGEGKRCCDCMLYDLENKYCTDET